MLRTLRDRVTYANTTATLALIVALGGTSYAALTLPRNSVGHRQMQAGAVRSREVKNGALQVADLSGKARSALRGSTGPQGVQGPAGAAAAQFFAVVQADGQRASGNATGGGRQGSSGNYLISFSRSMAGCSAVATLGTPDATTTVAGRVNVSIVDGQVGVHTFAADGSPADLPFHLIAAC